MKVHTILCLLCLFSSVFPVICDDNITKTELNDEINMNKIPFIIKFWLFTEIMVRII